MAETLRQALSLLISFDQHVLVVIALSLQVSLSALFIGVVIGLPLGAWLALHKFPGRTVAIVVMNTLMGLPSVVVGVMIYLALSRSGPFGSLGLLFTPWAMILAQSMLAIPLVAAVSRQIIEDAWKEYVAEFSVYRIRLLSRLKLLLIDCRFSLLVAVLAGMGRTMSEVGAAMIVGGNIEGFTRVMTTTIALETSKGDLPLSIALGVLLMSLILILNVFTYWLKRLDVEAEP